MSRIFRAMVEDLEATKDRRYIQALEAVVEVSKVFVHVTPRNLVPPEVVHDYEKALKKLESVERR